jgi:hypothetical protein
MSLVSEPTEEQLLLSSIAKNYSNMTDAEIETFLRSMSEPELFRLDMIMDAVLNNEVSDDEVLDEENAIEELDIPIPDDEEKKSDESV